MRTLRIGLAQINSTVGSINGNVRKIVDHIGRAAEQDVDIVAFPELAVCGYPPEDLLFKPQFLTETEAAVEEIVRASKKFPDLTVVLGCIDKHGSRLYNAAAIAKDGAVLDIYHKHHLPNYGVFDEKRYFTSGRDRLVIEVRGVAMGIAICEDIWKRPGPADAEVWEGGADMVININASPYHIGKERERQRVLGDWCRDHQAALAYVNMVGGQDELIFDGQSYILNALGETVVCAAKFREELLVTDIDIDEIGADGDRPERAAASEAPDDYGKVKKIVVSRKPSERPPDPTPPSPRLMCRNEEVLTALALGLRDYAGKNGFSRAVLGLSGGVDSALTAYVAVQALGKDNVTAVFLPSRYTSAASLEDAAAVAANLGIEMPTIPIEPLFRTYLQSLTEIFDKIEPDVTEENIQARIRGNILMALSNKFGWLLLSTGNKSEMSVGYATLYGDMSGGFSVLKDIYKTLVYELCRYINTAAGREVIPDRVMTRAPSAELREDQKDSDALPEYSVLDPILRAYIEKEKGLDEIVQMGFEKEIVQTVLAMVDSSEYKRRQAPPGVKITPRAFGRDWRVPITNRFHLQGRQHFYT